MMILLGFSLPVLLVACQRAHVETAAPEVVRAYYALTQEFGFDPKGPLGEQVRAALPFERISLWRRAFHDLVDRRTEELFA